MPHPLPTEFSRRAMLGALTAASALVATSCASHPMDPALDGAGEMPYDAVSLTGDVEGYRTTLTLLGTAAGPRHVPGRSGIARVVSVGGHNYLVDAGQEDCSRLEQAGVSVDGLEAVRPRTRHQRSPARTLGRRRTPADRGHRSIR